MRWSCKQRLCPRMSPGQKLSCLLSESVVQAAYCIMSPGSCKCKDSKLNKKLLLAAAELVVGGGSKRSCRPDESWLSAIEGSSLTFTLPLLLCQHLKSCTEAGRFYKRCFMYARCLFSTLSKDLLTVPHFWVCFRLTFCSRRMWISSILQSFRVH